MKRRLFAHERELQSWRSLSLTSHRVIHLDARNGRARSTSIPLVHVQWTQVTRIHSPLLLALIVFSGILGFVALLNDAMLPTIATILAALVLGVAYMRTRRVLVALASGGGRIELVIAAGKDVQQQARDFLDAVEAAVGHPGARTLAMPNPGQAELFGVGGDRMSASASPTSENA